MAFIQIFRIILGCIPFILLCLSLQKININKADRGKQFLMPFIAVVYCFVMLYFAESINSILVRIFESLQAEFPVLENINFAIISIYVFNTAFVVIFIILKRILLFILKRVWSSTKIMENTSGHFYKYNPETDKWFLKNHLANVRKFYQYFYISYIMVVCLLFVLSQHFKEWAIFETTLYPVVGIIILGEIVAYINGMTHNEFIKNILFDDEDSYKVSNYGLLRNILKDLFDDHVLYDSTIDTCISDSSTYESLVKLSNSEDSLEKRVGTYFLKLKENKMDIDINYVDSCINLLKGKSTLINNPFYGDLTNYIMLPLTKSLMSYRKGLIVVSRESSADDVKAWVDRGLESFTNTKSLWKSRILDLKPMDDDIGIIKFSDIYNLQLYAANQDFLSKVGFIILIEPSHILSSGQVGLNLLVNHCESPDKEMVYCACDRNCDGLVDTLSHVLKTNITEVTATIYGNSNSTEMYWNASGNYMHHKIFPHISRYLGIGTEINAVAMKHQIPEVTWLGNGKFPVNDIRWIAGQYYKQICDYANLSPTQDEFNKHFKVDSNLWNYPINDNTFLVVEDEFSNLFEMTRVYTSRAKQQGFLNIISENYLLRDYMIDNVDIFSSDPKAIPTFVPDYSRSERNVVLKLIMLMINGPLDEEKIEKELMLCNIVFDDAYSKLRELIVKHCNVKDPTLTVIFKEKLDDDGFNTRVFKQYQISETNELYEYALGLKTAYIIAEDEEGEVHHIGSKLYGHVFQSFLPGQYMTFEGKYYEVQTITPQNGVIVRRASEHIDTRHSYRQLRRIVVDQFTEKTDMASKKTVSDIEIAEGYGDFRVETDGYLDLSSYEDIKNAKKTLINGIPTREYKNKTILRIKLPGSTEAIRQTICMLLNEIFVTTYPASYHYISAITKTEHKNELVDIMYKIEGALEDECIYIVEDSEIDLGLIVSFERNIKRYLEIITEFLSWHQEKMAEVVEEEEEVQEYEPEFVEVEEKPKSIFRRFFQWLIKLLKKIFRIKDKTPETTSDTKQETEEETEQVEDPIDQVEDQIEEETDEFTEEEIDESTEDTEESDEEVSRFVLKETMAEQDIDGDDEQSVHVEPKETVYQKRCFLKFGYDSFNEAYHFDETIEYLKQYGFDQSALHVVRTKKGIAEELEESYDPNKFGVHYCDFCGVELSTNYDVLKDGRERCNKCSSTAVKTVEEFRDLYKSVLRNMEVYFGIKINVAIKVRMTDAKTIARHFGETFVATPGFDGRTLGFAQKDKNGYTIFIENGSPRLAAIGTLAHELTHIWQYLNWDDKEIIKAYGKKNRLQVYEGMAMWAQIQYLLLMNEVADAKRNEIMTRGRDDVYGHGFIQYANKYPLTYGSVVKHSPFKEKLPF